MKKSSKSEFFYRTCLFQIISREERKLKTSYTVAALGVKKARGQRVGQIPYGYKLAADGKHLTECFEELAVIDDIVRARKDGKTLKQITEMLNARKGEGYARGLRWHVTTVRRIINRKMP